MQVFSCIAEINLLLLTLTPLNTLTPSDGYKTPWQECLDGHRRKVPAYWVPNLWFFVDVGKISICTDPNQTWQDFRNHKMTTYVINPSHFLHPGRWRKKLGCGAHLIRVFIILPRNLDSDPNSSHSIPNSCPLSFRERLMHHC